ncbi:uncharacterized protein B0H18DRAFT_1106455 [Fomitopsis serialis]|uniref:uncharacterized protein n=1 Tax=Fomitopsis serialis TaxID=139415 RepID=UPI002007FE17|nr:uncharacterized protein B0H18DRAFT_1106455 [Neoantrodia serialis]KAH9919939.1 hypothetical protein B0H18DRAFT_1106455 [Neoantrodia serialis]
MAAWDERIREYPRSVDDYLSSMVPSHTTVPRCPPTGGLFKVVPIDNAEVKMHDPLVKALILQLRHNIMKFPFGTYESEQHPTKPDVIATMPALSVVEPAYQWRDVTLVFVLHSELPDDPVKNRATTHEATLAQLAQSARNIMLSQGRLFAFVVGIYGDQARIFRFDRVGAICSPRFEYKKRPEIFHEFLWRLLHPRLSGCTVVGEDPTMKPGTRADLDLVHSLEKNRDPDWVSTDETPKAVRRITVTDKQKHETTYLTYKLLFVNPELFSRATLVWEAYKVGEERRTRVGGRAETRGKCAAPEIAEPCTSGHELVGYRTIAGAHNAPEMGRLNERSHTRLVLETVGTPLAIQAYEAAGHGAARRHRGTSAGVRGGVIHRDISEGNVMIAPEGAAFSGFIQDLDYSFNWKWFLYRRKMQVDLAKWEEYCVQHGYEPRSKEDPDNDSKERTGTVYFMAIEILRSEITHEARHDLEHQTILAIEGVPPLKVPGNEPLTSLLENLRVAFTGNFRLRRVGVEHRTHREILDIFDKVLASNVVWPENDAALEWKLPQTATLPPEMAKSVCQSVQPGSLDPRTGANREFPCPPVTPLQGASDRPQRDDDQQGAIAGVSRGDGAGGQVQQGQAKRTHRWLPFSRRATQASTSQRAHGRRLEHRSAEGKSVVVPNRRQRRSVQQPQESSSDRNAERGWPAMLTNGALSDDVEAADTGLSVSNVGSAAPRESLIDPET